MKFLSATLLIALGVVAEEELAPVTQLAILWDGGLQRWQPDFYAKFVNEGLRKITEDHFGIFMSLSSFSDKPAPFTGIGNYGGYPSHWNEDWCYLQGQSFSSSYEHIATAIESIPESTGLDQWDAQFEAMINAVHDRTLGWVPGTKKIIAVVTNSFGHSAALDTLADNINYFNEDVVCAGENKTTGGFGSTDTPDLAGWVAPVSLSGEEMFPVYEEYSQLLAQKICNPESQDEDRDARIAELKAKFEPTKVPAPLDFDLAKLISSSEDHCKENEYPAYADVVSALQENDISFLLIFANANKLDHRAYPDEIVWNWALTEDEALGRLSSVMQVINRDNLDNLPELISASIAQLLE